ncbi:MAG: hypothetical protein ACE5HI_01380 [bacterium]
MKSLLFLIFVLIPGFIWGQNGLVPSFKLAANELELTRIVRTGTYFDKVGRKFAILGNESGSFEAWAYPLKLFRNFEFSFIVRT